MQTVYRRDCSRDTPNRVLPEPGLSSMQDQSGVGSFACEKEFHGKFSKDFGSEELAITVPAPHNSPPYCKHIPVSESSPVKHPSPVLVIPAS